MRGKFLNIVFRVLSLKDALHRPSSRTLRARRWSLSFSATRLPMFILILIHSLHCNAWGTVTPTIISLAPDLTEIIYALHLEDHLIAVSEYSDFPPPAKKLPTMGSFISPNIEKILFLKPSIVLAQEEATPLELLNVLKKNTIEILSFHAQNEDDIYTTLSVLGKKFDRKKNAFLIMNHMKKEFLKLQKLTQKHPKPRVLIQIEEAPLMIAGKNTLIHRAIELAGGINVASSYAGYPKLQREVILKLNPDVIIIPVTPGQEEKTKEMMRGWKSKHAYTISGDILTRATPRFCEGVQELFKKIHAKSD